MPPWFVTEIYKFEGNVICHDESFLTLQHQYSFRDQGQGHRYFPNTGRVFVPFKQVPVCNQKSVIKNMFLCSSRKRIVYDKVEYGCFHSFV